MNTIVVWYLITLGGVGSNQVVYSPPMPDLATCEFLKKSAEETVRQGYIVSARCVQIKTVVTK